MKKIYCEDHWILCQWSFYYRYASKILITKNTIKVKGDY